MNLETKWLDDFVALAATRSFSQAAEKRFVTQPAFSRRIRALEEWVGVALFDRLPHGVALTPAGEQFRAGADETLRSLQQARGEARAAAGKEASTLRFAATHALSFTFFPHWIRTFEGSAPFGTIRLISDHMKACEEVMLHGQAQFLLCHHHDAAPSVFAPGQFVSRVVGTDTLVPLVAARGDGAPLWRLPGAAATPLRLLGYSLESGLGRIVAACRTQDGRDVVGETVLTSHLAAVLLSMARDGHGVAWLPLSLAERDLAAGRLVRAGAADWDIPLQICLFRPRVRLGRAAERFWEVIAG